MSFGKTIKTLRREHDMTQERLAEILSITPQAISRWETDLAMPDISLIAPICHLFDITSDELLGIDMSHKQIAVEKICDEAGQYSSRGYLEKAREILENGLRKYPDNLDIIYDLMYLASWQKDSTGDKKHLAEAIKWGEIVLERSTQDYQRHGAIQVLCFGYRDAGRLDDAVKMAESMPILCCSQELLLSQIHSGDEGYRAKQREAINLLQALSTTIFYMQTERDSGEMTYSPEEDSALRDKRISFLHLLFENGDFGFYHMHLCETHREQAIYYAQKENHEKALYHLSLSAEHAVKFITSVNEEHTSLVFRGMVPGSWAVNYTDNEATRLLKIMERAVFDQIREKDEFLKIKASLLEQAGDWAVQK